MIFNKTKLDGLYIIDPEAKNDERGYFSRVFCKNEFAKNGLDFNIVQVSRSLTKKKGTIRGLHFQKEPNTEDKIIGCIKGKIFDVAVDLRQDSPTFGQWVSQELSQENQRMFLIPKGYAHGFQTLADGCEMLYFMTEYYCSECTGGVLWNDPFLKITWPLKNPILSEKDKNWLLIK
ncbi:MAG: dTDP-4-dehydrorhamnose 3,5-epimerase [Candidatus Shapirobacteria bacterium]|jgi:dTDP-4-dehydrorhamnose 3,5-epimerase|nr:dTDP-4-dehydrorhamnose 3,5-epimerase [Candidatus Shapirobacteria bacterium]